MIGKMKTIAATAALATAMMLGAQAAHAVTLGSCVVNDSDGELVVDVTNKVLASSSCFSLPGLADGDDDKLNELNGVAINGDTGGWSSLGKFEALGSNTYFSVSGTTFNDENEPLSGTWKLFNAATSVYDEFMMIFKAGQDGNTDPAAFVGYILTGTSGTWSSPHFGSNDEFRGLSNVDLFVRGQAPVVPLPAAGWLLLMGLGGLGVASRRKRKAQAA